MKQTTQNYTLKALGMGAIAGMRALSAPAILSNELQDAPTALLANSPLRYLQKGPVATGLKWLAVTEMAGDKVPNSPDRIALPQIGVRAISGAVVGATIFTVNNDRPLKGAALGGVAAIAATYATFYLRKALHDKGKVPNLICGLIEDGIMLKSGLAIAKK